MSIKLKDQNNNEIFIAGTNSEDFIDDKVLRNDKTWSSNKIVEELYPTFQKEGNPVICYPVENYPLNVKATFLPKQAGTGDPSPENVRPISGYDSVDVTQSKDGSQVKQITLTLPETIYGGTVDAVTGEGSKTWGFIASYNGESLPGEWISNRDVYAPGTTPTTGAQVAYKLATPEPFRATGNQALPAVAGLNTLYTDGDSLIISGKEDIKYTINQITSNIQNINQIQEINNILLGVE